MNSQLEKEVFAIIEEIDLAAACPECGHLSLVTLASVGPCPHCHPDTIPVKNINKIAEAITTIVANQLQKIYN
jgi:Zn finger protein HypA/HybF involved in hydrogenase expression